MEKVRKPRNYWNEQTLVEEALKYEYRSEFAKHCSGGYTTAAKIGLLDKICSHMKLQGNLNMRYLYKVSFEDGAIYIGLSCNPEKRFEQHMCDESSSVYKYMIKTGYEPMFDLINDTLYPAEEAAQLEGVIINQYKDSGWEVLNIAKGGALGGKQAWWNFDTVQEVALRYTSKPEFRNKDSKAYYAAKRLGIIDEVCKHMEVVKRVNNYWTKEKVLKECIKYKTKSELLLKANSLYKAAKRLNFINEMYKEMGLTPKGDKSHLYR